MCVRMTMIDNLSDSELWSWDKRTQMTLVRKTTVSHNVLPVKACHRNQQGFAEWQDLFWTVLPTDGRCEEPAVVDSTQLYCMFYMFKCFCLLLKTLQYNFNPPTCNRLVVLA